jgi:hypothetical protein
MNTINDIIKEEPKKKRGRKPKSLTTKKNMEKHNLRNIENNNDYILHLKITKEDLIEELEKVNETNFEEDFMNYKSKISPEPSAFDEISGYDNLNFTSQPSTLNKFTLKDKINDGCIDNVGIKIAKEDNIVICNWDCHPIKRENNETIIYGLPIKYYKGKFYTTGQFCSLECVASYNFSNQNRHIQDVWETYSLINLMAIKLGYDEAVKLAPERESLKALDMNGWLTIEQFRDYCYKRNNIINKLNYPLISVGNTMVEIHHNDGIHNSYNKERKKRKIVLDDEKIKRLEEEEMIKTKMQMKNNHLVNSMNIMINL